MWFLISVLSILSLIILLYVVVCMYFFGVRLFLVWHFMETSVSFECFCSDCVPSFIVILINKRTNILIIEYRMCPCFVLPHVVI